MARGKSNDKNESIELVARTASFDPAADEAVAAREARTQPDKPDKEPSQPPTPPDATTDSDSGRHQRRPGFAIPLLVFMALLAAAGAVGWFVVPAGGPDVGSEPPAAALSPPASPTPPTPELSPLPTPPARPADLLAPWASRVAAAVDIPVTAIQAYGYAQLMLRQTDSQCHLSWTTLAGIGEVESRHGQANGAVLDSTGRSTPLIVGPVLNGQGGRALVKDTDAGAFDGDTAFDRAMGPLRLTPQRWRDHAIDADNDGIVDPYDLDDSALALARMLCSGPDDLSARTGWSAALARYRTGDSYANSVFTAADSYGQRTRDIT